MQGGNFKGERRGYNTWGWFILSCDFNHLVVLELKSFQKMSSCL